MRELQMVRLQHGKIPIEWTPEGELNGISFDHTQQERRCDCSLQQSAYDSMRRAGEFFAKPGGTARE